jgi:hypothetical protein
MSKVISPTPFDSRSAANPNAGAIVAARRNDRVGDSRRNDRMGNGHGPAHDSRATRSDASRMIDASRAGGGVGLRDWNREQAKSQQAGSDCLIIRVFL